MQGDHYTLCQLTLRPAFARALHDIMRNGGSKQAQLAALTFALLLKTPGCSVRLPGLFDTVRMTVRSCRCYV